VAASTLINQGAQIRSMWRANELLRASGRLPGAEKSASHAQARSHGI
jgi:hypothetical protein